MKPLDLSLGGPNCTIAIRQTSLARSHLIVYHDSFSQYPNSEASTSPSIASCPFHVFASTPLLQFYWPTPCEVYQAKFSSWPSWLLSFFFLLTYSIPQHTETLAVTPPAVRLEEG